MIKHLYETFAHRWYHGGRVFIYSDPHFGDIDSYTFRFPEVFTENNMNKLLIGKIFGKEQADLFYANCVKELDKMQIDNINAVCTKNDTIIILGDVGNVDGIKKLKAGYKVLITGNHDAGISNYKRAEIFTELADEETSKNLRIISGKRYDYQDNKLFDEVYEGPLFISDKIILSHEPVEFPFALNIHGHVHNKEYQSKGINCCAECINYKPICLDTIIKSGKLKNIVSIHRDTIDNATKRKAKSQANPK